MLESEAAAIVAALQAAFPRGADRDETLQLYRAKLLRYEAQQALAAVNDLVDTRTDPWFPTWAEVANALRTNRLRLRELEQPTVPPDDATLKRFAELREATGINERSEAWLRGSLRRAAS